MMTGDDDDDDDTCWRLVPIKKKIHSKWKLPAAMKNGRDLWCGAERASSATTSRATIISF